MRFINAEIQLSASDLGRHLSCRHLTSLDLRAARGELKRIYKNDPSLEVLIERGFRHEAAYLAHLKERGLDVLEDDADLKGPASRIQRTADAMRAGAGVIAQADLQLGAWRGRADALIRVEKPSALGPWSYEVVDTKLARETKGRTILQLCLYSELVAGIQNLLPEYMYVVPPERGFNSDKYRVHDYLAYYRFVKGRLHAAVGDAQNESFYPEPVEFCDLCDWWTLCNERRRSDDHLSFVGGISRLQIDELQEWEVTTLDALARVPIPLQRRPSRGSAETYVKAREQARLQLSFRTTGKRVHELLPLEPGRGLTRLPEPCPGDIFLDFEGDPFVEGGGLEYLLGYATINDEGEPEYSSLWALNRVQERRMFETFMDRVAERQARFPALHIYHYSQYEPTALKRLMGRYATRQEEIDCMLRAGVFVDLYSITRQSLRASVERYSPSGVAGPVRDETGAGPRKNPSPAGRGLGEGIKIEKFSILIPFPGG